MRIRTWIEAGMMTLGALAASACDDVTGPEVGSIDLLLESDILLVDEKIQLQTVVLSVDGDTLADKSVRFGSSNNSVIQVSVTGLAEI